MSITHALSVQAQAYRKIFHGLANSVVEGDSACAFVLGAPHGGKSYALLGKDGDFAKMGFVGRLASDLIDKVSEEGQPRPGNSESLVLMMSSFLVQV
jgi:hypothetical protein